MMPSILGQPAGELSLRVRGTSRDGQVVRLSAAKCTVGSGKRCTLRLRAPGVQPVHCLILRGPNGTVVRSWSPDTRLNGRTFRESPLVAGDCLTFGPIGFEVLPSSGEVPPYAQRMTEVRRHGRRRVSALASRVRDLQVRLAELETLGGKRAAGDTARQQEKASRARRREEAERGRRSELLERSLAQLEEKRQEIEKRRLEWEDRRAGLEAQLAERSAALDLKNVQLCAELESLEQQKNVSREASERAQAEQSKQRAELEQELAGLADRKHEARVAEQFAQRSAELEREHAQWEARRAEEESQLAWRKTELHAEIARIAADRDIFDRKREAWENERRQTEEKSSEHERQIDEARAALEQERGELERTRQQFESEQNESRAQGDARSAELAERQQACEAAAREIETSRAEHEARSAALADERRELQAARNRTQTAAAADEDKAKTALAELQAQLARISQEMETDRQKFASEREQWDAQRVRDQAELQAARQDRERGKEWEARKTVLERQFHLSAQERREAEIERDEAIAKLDETTAQLDESRLKLQEREAEVARLLGQLEARPAQPERLAALAEHEPAEIDNRAGATGDRVSVEPHDAEAPQRRSGETVDDVLERLRNLALLKEQEDRVEQTASVEQKEQTRQDEPAIAEPEHELPVSQTQEPPMQEELKEAPVGQPANPTDGSPDESIEDYMSRLLHRMRSGGQGSQSGRAAEPQPAKAAAPAHPTSAGTVNKIESERGPSAAISEPAAAAAVKAPPKTFPRSAPPELSDLAAMRALANSQARTAITTHSKKLWAKATISKGVWAALAFLTSAAVLIFTPSGYAVVELIATFGLATGVYFVFEAARMSKRFFAEAKKSAILLGHKSPDAAAEADPEAAKPVNDNAAK